MFKKPLCLVTTAVFCLAVVPKSSVAALDINQDGQQRVVFQVNDPRPLAAAIMDLNRYFGWRVTYEDPLYLNDYDLLDITTSVSRDTRSGRRTVVPKGGRLELIVAARGDVSSAGFQMSVLVDLLKKYAESGYPGQFGVRQSDGLVHVVPLTSRGVGAVDHPRQSLLDRVVSVSTSATNALDQLANLAAEVGRTGKGGLALGSVPVAELLRSRTNLGSGRSSARAQLVRIVDTIAPRLSWQILCQPGDEELCYLNIYQIK